MVIDITCHVWSIGMLGLPLQNVCGKSVPKGHADSGSEDQAGFCDDASVPKRRGNFFLAIILHFFRDVDICYMLFLFFCF